MLQSKTQLFIDKGFVKLLLQYVFYCMEKWVI
jgi:hypothetical protein